MCERELVSICSVALTTCPCVRGFRLLCLDEDEPEPTKTAAMADTAVPDDTAAAMTDEDADDEAPRASAKAAADDAGAADAVCAAWKADRENSMLLC